jgi:hypothetical protein
MDVVLFYWWDILSVSGLNLLSTCQEGIGCSQTGFNIQVLMEV